MVDGVNADLNELIALRRYARSIPKQLLGKTLQPGLNSSKLRGRGMHFSEVRNYQAGDEIRHMEWRVTARTGRPHIKLYQEEKERPVVIMADFSPSMIFGTQVAFKSVIAARLAALLAWTVVAQGDRVGGFFFSATEHNEFIPRGRDSGVLPLLASLSYFTQQNIMHYEQEPQGLLEALTRIRRVVKPGSILILISDFYSMNTESEKQLNRLRAHSDLLAYHICDPLELSPPKPNQYNITNGQEELLLNTRADTIFAAYDKQCQQKIERLREQFKRLQIPYVQTTAHTNLYRLVQKAFPRRSHG
jgi:uncharacterized protein (DUF58 family)